MAWLDWCIVGAYIAVALGIGLLFTRRAAKSTTDFFIAGRSLPWIVAGTSMVATSFSADTPLFVAGMSRDSGIASNWFWWSAAIGQIATIFFFARLWRRTKVVTDIEFLVLRYKPSRARNVLRVFKVFYDGILINCVIMASVTLAMAKILHCMLNLSEDPLVVLPVLGIITPTTAILIVLGAVAILYSSLSGLYGVVYTDLLQFILAMIGSIGLAVIVYMHTSSGDGGLLTRLAGAPEFQQGLLRFFPDLSQLNWALFTFFVYIGITWWAQAPGGGYMVQRLLATRSETDSMLAFLWYNFCHYVLRPWPWILVGLLSLIYYPHLEDSEMAFPLMIDRFLPAGLKGVMVASMLAAFMSTIDTQLNWGASYLINDLYKPYLRKPAWVRFDITASRLGMVLLTLIFLLVTTRMTSILDAYKYLGVIFGGLGTVMIARWYWWRVNAYSEISALIACFVVGNAVELYLPSTDQVDRFGLRVLITVVGVTVIWMVVTLLTTRSADDQTLAFHRRMKVPGPGWRRIRRLTGIQGEPGEFRDSVVAWLTCTLFMFSILLGSGKLLFHDWGWASVYIIMALGSGWLLNNQFKQLRIF